MSEGINRFAAGEGHGVLLITHYTRILRYVQPDFVHVFVGGRIVDEGGSELAEELEREGYEKFLDQGAGPHCMTFDVARIRKDFPILDRTVRGGQPLVYLDSANTSQKPRQVLDAMTDFYERHNANIHRASHQLGEEATEAYEGARIKVGRVHRRADETEVVFTKNISEAINLVAYSMSNATAARSGGRFALGPGDEIVITEMEHHSNIVPWQLLCQRTGATLRWFGVTPDGRLDTSAIDDLITERTKLVALAHQSNVLGTINPVRAIADRAHAAGALVLVDAAQSVPHMPVDVAALGADFLGFTGHKMCGPTGIGVLWGRRELLEEMPPFLGGGEMIESVWMERSTFAPPPHKFEAGTMPIARGGRPGRGHRLPRRGRPAPRSGRTSTA